MIESEVCQFVCFHGRVITKKMLNLIHALKASTLKVCTIIYSINAMCNKRGSTYTCYTDSMCINVAALYIWMGTYCFLSMKKFFQLMWESQQLHKETSMIKAHVNDQNVLQLMYLLAVQLTMSLGGQLTLETFWIFKNCWLSTQYTIADNVKTAQIKMTVCLNTAWLVFSA